MALCELDSDDAFCKKGKTTLVRAHLDSVAGLEEFAEYDLVISSGDAREVLSDSWEAFLKRNRLDGDVETIYLDKVKKEADREVLLPRAEKLYTGWFEMDSLPEETVARIMERKSDENTITGWDMLSFDEMRDACAECPLSWDNGRGCIGTFGPETSLLPEIAEKHGCELVASVPAMVKNGERFSPQDAGRLLKEVEILRERLPDEGKMMVRRYGGVLDRLEKMGETCASFGTRFYFI